MHNGSVATATLVLAALWSAVFVSITTCIVLMATGHAHFAQAAGFLACVFSAVAGSATVTHAVRRGCDLARALHGMKPSVHAERPRGVHPLS